MDSRERFLKALRREQPDRVPIHDSPWLETIWRWQKEGLPQDIPVEDYFDYELVGFGFDGSPMFPVQTIHKDHTFIVERTSFGGVRRNFRNYASTPEVLDWPIKCKEDWLRIKPRLLGDMIPDYTRVDWATMRNRHSRARSEGKCICLAAVTGYDLLQSYVRSEDLLVLMVEDPAWFADMVRTNAGLVLRMARMMMEAGFEFDSAFLYNDMAYLNGPLFSPKLYRSLIMDSDASLCDFFHTRSMPVMYHTDGDIRQLLPHMIEAGVDCVQPLEAKAKMDVRELKEVYGDRLTFFGNIDVRKMSHRDPAAIEDEIAGKFEVAKVGGGYIYHSDHSVPPDVSFEQYTRVMDLVRKYGTY